MPNPYTVSMVESGESTLSPKTPSIQIAVLRDTL